MMTKSALASAVVLLWLACSRGAPAHSAPPIPPQASPPAAARPSTVVDASGAGGAPTLAPAARQGLPALVPLASGKRLRLRGVGSVDPSESLELEITVPPTFKLKMEGNEEQLPSAHLKGSGLEVVVEDPDAGFSTLADTKGMISRGDPAATFIRAEEAPDGSLLIYKATVAGIGLRFNVVVSRPRLKVDCGAYSLTQLSDAERAASICLSLRAAPDESGI